MKMDSLLILNTLSIGGGWVKSSGLTVQLPPMELYFIAITVFIPFFMVLWSGFYGRAQNKKRQYRSKSFSQ